MNQPESTTPKGTSDEAVGRPAPWREGRYQQPGKPVDQTVNNPSEDGAPHDTVGTQTPPDPGAGARAEPKPDPRDRPVTRRDYE
jgi:hypothetical protein